MNTQTSTQYCPSCGHHADYGCHCADRLEVQYVSNCERQLDDLCDAQYEPKPHLHRYDEDGFCKCGVSMDAEDGSVCEHGCLVCGEPINPTKGELCPNCVDFSDEWIGEFTCSHGKTPGNCKYCNPIDGVGLHRELTADERIDNLLVVIDKQHKDVVALNALADLQSTNLRLANTRAADAELTCLDLQMQLARAAESSPHVAALRARNEELRSEVAECTERNAALADLLGESSREVVALKRLVAAQSFEIECLTNIARRA